jgi:hypothetical protein
MQKIKFVTAVPPIDHAKPLHVYLQVQNESEVEVRVTDGEVEAIILGIRAKDGTVVRYVGQQKAIEALGLAEDNGVIKMYN